MNRKLPRTRTTGWVSRGGLDGETLTLPEETWQAIGRSLDLSVRELQIVRGILVDRTEFAIAAGLKISPHTVHTHVERLHRKLGITNRVQLVVLLVNEFLRLTAVPETLLPPVCPRWRAGTCPLGGPTTSRTEAPSLPPAIDFVL